MSSVFCHEVVISMRVLGAGVASGRSPSVGCLFSCSSLYCVQVVVSSVVVFVGCHVPRFSRSRRLPFWWCCLLRLVWIAFVLGRLPGGDTSGRWLTLSTVSFFIRGRLAGHPCYWLANRSSDQSWQVAGPTTGGAVWCEGLPFPPARVPVYIHGPPPSDASRPSHQYISRLCLLVGDVPMSRGLALSLPCVFAAEHPLPPLAGFGLGLP